MQASTDARAVLLKKQQAVAKRVRALTKKLGANGPTLVNDGITSDSKDYCRSAPGLQS